MPPLAGLRSTGSAFTHGFSPWARLCRPLRASPDKNTSPYLRTGARPKDWADSYLLAFANSSELTLVTFDRGFLHRYQHVIVLRKAE
jgi:hypothetical protein